MSEIIDEPNYGEEMPMLLDLDHTDEVRFVLESVIEFIEELKLSGDELVHAGQLLRDVEALRDKL